MRGAFTFSFGGLVALVATSAVVSCSSPEPVEEVPAASSEINAKDEGIEVGPSGGGVRDPSGVLSVVVFPGALDETVRIAIGRVSDDGARGTPRYRVTMSPPRGLAIPAHVIFDLEKSTGSTSIDPTDLRLAISDDPDAAPTTPLAAARRADVSPLEIVGSASVLDRTFGLVEAAKIDCGGETCSTCCLDEGQLSCNATCGSKPAEIVVECLRDSDCGSGLKCCAPTTQRGGGVLRVDDNRITCKADCGGENLHVCDLNDPDRCSTCTPAKAGCSRGYCGEGAKTPTQLLCP